MTTVNQIFMLIGLCTTARRKTREDNKIKRFEMGGSEDIPVPDL